MSPASNDPIPLKQQRDFLDLFEKDVAFFRLVFLLIDQSCPIKKIDLVWAEDGPARRVGLASPMGTADALNSGCAALLGHCENHPDPQFCDIVNDSGRRLEISCAVSDKAAERRVRETGKPWVYQCHAGLVDMAVPVMCRGQHIATLLTGQVLRRPPRRREFVKIRQSLSHLDYIDMCALETAYMAVPVVSDTEIQRAVRILELFAEYLATSWMRVQELVKDQERKTREQLLLRREFAHLLLQGTGDQTTMRGLMKQLGFHRRPDRAMVIKLEPEPGQMEVTASLDLAFSKAMQQVEQACLSIKGASFATLRDQGTVIFITGKEDADQTASDMNARSEARRLLNCVGPDCELRVRVGIGRSKKLWGDLVASYNEAREALAQSEDTIVEYCKLPPAADQVTARVNEICGLIQAWKLNEAQAAIHSLPLRLGEQSGKAARQTSDQRRLLASALDTLCFTIEKTGIERDIANRIHSSASLALETARAPVDLHQAFVDFGEDVLDELRRLYKGKKEKLVDRARRIIDRGIQREAPPPELSLARIAESLGVSAGHLSRTFRKLEGTTFERYLMIRRVDYAKQLLLDPFNNVSSVSERSGFSDPTYFSRVFRSLVGIPPSAFARTPVPPAVHDSPPLQSGYLAGGLDGR